MNGASVSGRKIPGPFPVEMAFTEMNTIYT